MTAGIRGCRCSSAFLDVAILLGVALCGTLAAGAAPKEASDGEWPPITAEEKSLSQLPQDPEAEAVVLNTERNGKILRKAADWVNVLDYHWRLKVLTEGGKRFGEVRIRANKRSRVSNVRARTVKKDGTTVPVPSEQIFEKEVFKAGSVRIVELVFNFPAVEPGAILEYRYDRHDDFLLAIDTWFFDGPDFTLRSRVTQAFPVGMGYLILCDLCPASVPPKLTDWREGNVKGQLYAIELRDLPGYRDELLMPPQREAGPRLEMSLKSWKDVAVEALGRQDQILIDWSSVAQWAGFNYDRAAREGRAAVKALVDGWLQGVTDPQDRIKAVVRHVQEDFRYIPYDTVLGDVRSFDTILKEKNADNEEKAVLLRAALDVAGIESQVALVTGKDFGSLNPKFFSFSQFSHAVVAVPRSDGGVQWLDPTVSHAPFGFTPWKDSGAGALLIKGKSGELTTLPLRVEVSATRYRVTVKPAAGGRAELEVEAEYVGEDAIEMRDELRPVGDAGRRTYLIEWVEERRPGATLGSYALENLDDVDKPLKIKMTFETPGLVMVADEATLVRGCVLSCMESNPVSRGRRLHPFFVDRGWSIEESVLIQPPAAASAPSVPPSAQAHSSLATYSLGCFPRGEGTALCTRRYVAKRNHWSASELAGFRSMLDKIVEADRATVAFRPAGGAAARAD